MAEDSTPTGGEDHVESAPEELLTVVVGERHDEVREQSPTDDSWPVDEQCAAAIDLARDALLEEADAAVVGEHVGLAADGPMVVTHYFRGSVPGYTGWQWSVTVTRAPDSDRVTVDETALLPDGSGLLAPAWVPWRQRIEAGDLGTGDVMVTDPGDVRLVPGMSDNDLPEPNADDELHPEQWELGLGRQRLLSPEGRREAAQRWYREVGPRAALARATDLQCATCGFLLLIGGPLGQGFGVCANGYSPVDGRIVALNFGCGAHSETREQPSVGVAETVIDEMSYDDMGPALDLDPAGSQDGESAAGSDGVESAGSQDGESAAEVSTNAAETPSAVDGDPGGLDARTASGEDNSEPGPDGPPTGGSEARPADEEPSAPDDRTDHATMHEPGSEEGT